ncbi:MAG: TIGR04190 family B12-binding domain/radical SAM domain protein [Candidatus Methanospirareceae archaeon]
MIPKPDLVLLHAPSVYDFRKRPIMFGPISDSVPSTPIFEMYPIGFTTIAEHLERNGINVRIVNLAVRMLKSRDFDAEGMIKRLKTKAFGIDFHWLVHAQGSIEVAKICKKYHPRIPIIFGGFSATYFYEELIRYPEVDFIIRGDSTEEPLLQLMKEIVKGGSHFERIPNLVWKSRDNGEVKIHVNPFTNVCEDINGFSNNYAIMFKSALKYFDVKSLIPFHGWASHDWFDYPILMVITCRGCVHDCIFCGGSNKALRGYCNRKKPAFRDPKLIVKDVARMATYTKAPIFVIGDIRQAGEEYAYTVLRGLKELKIKNQIVFELFNTATKEYIEEVAHSVRNFNFEISPESHDEKIRHACGKHYSNSEMEKTIKWALDFGCNRFDVFFMIGLPFQTPKSVMETIDYCKYLLEKFGNRVNPFIFPFAPFIDPGSIAYENPEKYGYKILFKTLSEYRKAFTELSWKYALNYETKWMSRDEIVAVTYQASLALNKLKLEYGLIDEDTFRRVEERIRVAIRITEEIDKIREIRDEKERERRMMKFKSEMDKMLNSLILDKSTMEWPAAKRGLKLFNILRDAMRA